MEDDPMQQCGNDGTVQQYGHAQAFMPNAGSPVMYGPSFITPLGSQSGGSPVTGALSLESPSQQNTGISPKAVPLVHQREQILTWSQVPPWPPSPAQVAVPHAEVQHLEEMNLHVRNEAVRALQDQQAKFERVAQEFEVHASDKLSLIHI